MSIPSEATLEEEEEEEEPQQERNPEPSHHPTAPSDELFDISTTVDPGYIISLIRQLLPPDVRNCNKSHGVNACDPSTQGSEAEGREESAVLVSQNGLLNYHNIEIEAMDTVEFTGQDEGDDGSLEKQGETAGKDTWEDCGCILWDLAASKTHAEFMVQNLALDVLLANLMVPQSVRVTEITLGIIGNLACHEVSRKHIASTNGLIEVIVDQLFLDDASCLCEAYRVLTLGLQGCGYNAWAEALGPENILSRVLWVAENTLNPQLIEKSVGLLLAILQSEQEVVASLLPRLMQLGLPVLVVNLLTSEMSKLAGERVPERYSILDLILQTIEALSVIDDYSQEVSSNAELFQLLIDLVKFPDKIEVANSCVTAAILIANILTDVGDPALEISQDLSFLQGLFDIFPFASDDIEARSAIWSVIARLLVQVQVTLMSSSSLHQYVSVFLSKAEVIEDELLDPLDSCKDAAKLSARNTALRTIISILGQWTGSKESIESNSMGNNRVIDETIARLLEHCHKNTKSNAGS
ncbi:uncharacterized protein LOC131313519 isoform X2 [Rhododendron vialii]|uniref:uncharacterized protein LOC131313519 isoform X2 n=1 Tax=Rhododendron vialii TaxID=182163 RepID=UPI00265E386D|nr:uncharacterized protein LOC131313519 isoform X2 [Rhododendron vialii]